MMTTKQIGAFIAQNDRYAQLTGVEITETGKGFCKAKLKIEEKHLNAANIVQGGAIFTLADLAFGVASNSHGQLALAVNVNITFLKSTSSGTLYATATELTEPKRLGAYDVLVYDEKNELVARFNGVVYRKNETLLK
ncbi:MAG TPA: PaaI family thioesterase [Prolixibacteraceae bacterium]|nr:PaaI family thioesterase [Prolixibacteraceae bacterium]